MLRLTCAMVISTSVWLISCSRSPEVVIEKRSAEDSIYFKKWHYKDGVRKKIEAYNVRNKPHGLSLLYYPDGSLRDSSYLSDGKFHGNRYEFLPNGQLHSIALYDNGNELSRIDFSSMGTPTQYKAWNYELNEGFVVHYDSSGIQSFSGNAIYAYMTNDTIRKGKTADVELWVALPPDCIAKMVIGDSNKFWRKLVSKKVVIPDSKGSVSYPLSRKADQEIYRMHILTLKDTARNQVFMDTLYFHVARNGATSFSWKK